MDATYIQGIIPAMITPMTEDEALDENRSGHPGLTSKDHGFYGHVYRIGPRLSIQVRKF